MDLPTYTSIWKTKRIFYRIEDVKLPMPVPADVLLLTAVCFITWCGFWWATVGVAPFKAMFGGGAWFAAAACWYALPPFFAARMIARPNREGKNIPQIIASRVRYWTRPKAFDGYVSRRHIQMWLRARDARTRVPGTTDLLRAAVKQGSALGGRVTGMRVRPATGARRRMLAKVSCRKESE